MKKNYLFIIIFLNLSLFYFTEYCSADIHHNGRIQTEEWKINRTKVFKANDLYGHIDGGAELFLEIGFKQLTVQYFTRGKDELTLETYEMESPESALGIYLFKCGKETPVKEVKARNTGDKYQVMALKNNCYIALNNPKGNKGLFPDMSIILNKTLLKIKDKKAKNLFEMLPKDDLINNTQLIIRGQYSLQTIYTFGEGDILLLKGKIFGAAADYKDKENKTFTRIMVKYSDKNEAQTAFNYLSDNLDNTKKIIIKKSDSFIFLDHAKKYSIVKISNTVMDIKVNLLENPKE
jgi:hypothetical protein